MTRFIETIDFPVSAEVVFAFFSDFQRSADWDPSVVAAHRSSLGPLQRGSRFEVALASRGGWVPFEYRITEFVESSRLVLSAGKHAARSLDEINFVSRPAGTRVTYEASLELPSIRRLEDPVLDLMEQRIARLAECGLSRAFFGCIAFEARRRQAAAQIVRRAAA